MSEHEQLAALLGDLLQEQRNTTSAITSLAEAIAGVRAKAVAAKEHADVAVEKAQASAKKVVEAEADSAPTPAAPDVADYGTTSKAVTALMNAKGRDAAVALLASFGAKTLKTIPVEQYRAVIAACDEAMQ